MIFREKSFIIFETGIGENNKIDFFSVLRGERAAINRSNHSEQTRRLQYE